MIQTDIYDQDKALFLYPYPNNTIIVYYPKKSSVYKFIDKKLTISREFRFRRPVRIFRPLGSAPAEVILPAEFSAHPYAQRPGGRSAHSPGGRYAP